MKELCSSECLYLAGGLHDIVAQKTRIELHFFNDALPTLGVMYHQILGRFLSDDDDDDDDDDDRIGRGIKPRKPRGEQPVYGVRFKPGTFRVRSQTPATFHGKPRGSAMKWP